MADALDAYRATASEAQIQAGIVQGLEALGYAVLTIGQGRKRVRCPGCGMWAYPRGWQGNSEGAPDLYFRYPSWPPSMWAACEIKRPGGRIRPEQAALAATGHTFIARSWEDVAAWLQANWRLLSEGGSE